MGAGLGGASPDNGGVRTPRTPAGGSLAWAAVCAPLWLAAVARAGAGAAQVAENAADSPLSSPPRRRSLPLQSKTIATYLTAVRSTLEAAMCLENFSSQLVERHNKPQIETK